MNEWNEWIMKQVSIITQKGYYSKLFKILFRYYKPNEIKTLLGRFTTVIFLNY